jgi:hypothetical protein
LKNHKLNRTGKGKKYSQGKHCLLKMPRNLQVLFAAVMHHVEGSLEALLTLKVENSVICLYGTRKPTVPIIKQQ